MISNRQLLLTQAFTAIVVVIAMLLLVPLASNGYLAVRGQTEVQSTLLPRFISLTPAEALTEGSAAYSIGGGPNVSGIYMPNTSFNRFYTGFTLPPDYSPGSDITFRIMWTNGNTNATNCNFVLWANMLVAYRPGTSNFAFIAGGQFSNGLDTITLAAGPTAQAVRVENLTIKASSGSAGLQPGDALQIAIARRVDDIPDTCAGSLVVVGIDAIYQGLTSYLPLINR